MTENIKLTFREAGNDELETIMDVELRAFDNDPEIDTLVNDLFNDPSAEPIYSFLAYIGNEAVGHVLFTKAEVIGTDLNAFILAPMAVIPEYQKQGVGGKLIKHGLEVLKERGVEIVFVLGHIDYYPRTGFINDAGNFGFPAPYKILEEVKDAWMYQYLDEKAKNKGKGIVRCAKMMDKEEYWRE